MKKLLHNSFYVIASIIWKAEKIVKIWAFSLCILD